MLLALAKTSLSEQVNLQLYIIITLRLTQLTVIFDNLSEDLLGFAFLFIHQNAIQVRMFHNEI